MRPIKLTLQAFGPFADTQTVDFREALESRLFGIMALRAPEKPRSSTGCASPYLGSLQVRSVRAMICVPITLPWPWKPRLSLSLRSVSNATF